MRRLAVGLAVLVVALTGCGDAGVLDGLGERTREMVKGTTTTTTLLVAVAAGAEDEGLVRSADVLWFNDEIVPQYSGTSQEVIASVRERQERSRFAQASRSEIATALPSVLFPELVPQQVRWITSQLVYDELSGALDSDTSAAFGLWSDEPYQSDNARFGVLRIGRAPLEAPAVRSETTSIEVPDGISLAWTESGHRYELFCRAEVSEDLCGEVSLSTVPLLELRP